MCGNFIQQDMERITYPNPYVEGILQSSAYPYLFYPDGWTESLLTSTPSPPPFPPNGLALLNSWKLLNGKYC